MTTIAVTFALPAESSAFLRRLRSRCRADRNDISVTRGTINGRQVEVLHTGVGEKVCRERLGTFLEHQQFDALISTGFAGALDDRLGVGDLVLAKNFSAIELNEKLSSLPELPMRTADLLTLPRMIDSADERNQIARTSGAAAVDMETEFIARGCAEHGIPLLSLRVITDSPREPFPAPTDTLFDIARQTTDLPRFAAFFLAHPNRVPRLIQFAMRTGKLRKTLATALVKVVQNL